MAFPRFSLRGCFVFFIFLLALPLYVQAQEDTLSVTSPTNPFQVQGVSVDVRAKNAVMARAQAFDKALGLAWRQMCAQVSGDIATCQSASVPDVAAIGRALKDFSTTREQMGPGRYTATYDIRFKQSSARRLLPNGLIGADPAAEDIFSEPHPTTSSLTKDSGGAVSLKKDDPLLTPKIALVLPFFLQGGKMVLWSGDNPLKDSLERMDLSQAAFRLPMGELEDIQLLDESKGLSLTQKEVEPLVKKYGADVAVLALAHASSDIKSGPQIILYAPAGQLGGEAVPLETLSAIHQNTSQISMDGQVLYSLAAARMRDRMPGVLARLGRGEEAVAASTITLDQNDDPALPLSRGSVEVRVFYETMQEWQKIKSRIEADRSVLRVQIKRLTTKEARIRIEYQGNEVTLLQQLQSRGVKVRAYSDSQSRATQADVNGYAGATGWQMNNLDPAAGGEGSNLNVPRYDLMLMPSRGGI